VDEMDELEKLKKENEQLKLTVQQLRQQLEAYQKQAWRQFHDDYDHLPYHDHDRDRD
jgi:cell division protein FtsB